MGESEDEWEIVVVTASTLVFDPIERMGGNHAHRPSARGAEKPSSTGSLDERIYPPHKVSLFRLVPEYLYLAESYILAVPIGCLETNPFDSFRGEYEFFWTSIIRDGCHAKLAPVTEM